MSKTKLYALRKDGHTAYVELSHVFFMLELGWTPASYIKAK